MSRVLLASGLAVTLASCGESDGAFVEWPSHEDAVLWLVLEDGASARIVSPNSRLSLAPRRIELVAFEREELLGLSPFFTDPEKFEIDEPPPESCRGSQHLNERAVLRSIPPELGTVYRSEEGSPFSNVGTFSVLGVGLGLSHPVDFSLCPSGVRAIRPFGPEADVLPDPYIVDGVRHNRTLERVVWIDDDRVLVTQTRRLYVVRRGESLVPTSSNSFATESLNLPTDGDAWSVAGAGVLDGRGRVPVLLDGPGGQRAVAEVDVSGAGPPTVEVLKRTEKLEGISSTPSGEVLLAGDDGRVMFRASSEAEFLSMTLSSRTPFRRTLIRNDPGAPHVLGDGLGQVWEGRYAFTFAPTHPDTLGGSVAYLADRPTESGREIWATSFPNALGRKRGEEWVRPQIMVDGPSCFGSPDPVCGFRPPGSVTHAVVSDKDRVFLGINTCSELLEVQPESLCARIHPLEGFKASNSDHAGVKSLSLRGRELLIVGEFGLWVAELD